MYISTVFGGQHGNHISIILRMSTRGNCSWEYVQGKRTQEKSLPEGGSHVSRHSLQKLIFPWAKGWRYTPYEDCYNARVCWCGVMRERRGVYMNRLKKLFSKEETWKMRMSQSQKELAKAILKSISSKYLEEGASLISQELDRSVYSGWSE